MNMVNNKAIVKIINDLTEINGEPCKKTLQKIVFLIQAKQIDLGCDYGIHFYGPYSSDLDFAVRELCDEGILSIQYTSLEHKIHVEDKTLGLEYNNDIVSQVIVEFGKNTASELELLATALYVYLCDKDVEKVKSGVKKIKGEKYSDHRISEAIAKLDRNDFFVA